MPEVSDDGTTYTLTLRDGLKYSDGSPVKANDFEHTIKRVINLESGGSSASTPATSSAPRSTRRPARPRATSRASRPTTPRGEITIKITAAERSVPVHPRDGLRRPRAGRHAVREPDEEPAPGRRSVQDHVGRRPAAASCMEKNANYPEIEGHAGREAGQDHDQRGHAELARDHATCCRTRPTGLRRPARQRRAARVPASRRRTATASEVTNSTYYFFLNQRVKPFDNPRGPQGRQLRDRQAGARASVRRPARAGLQLPAPGHAGLREDRALPVRRPERRRRTSRRPSSHPGGRRRRRDGHGVRQRRGARRGRHGVPRRRPRTDRLQGQAADRRRRRSTSRPSATRRRRPQTGFANWFQDFPHPGNFMFLVDGSVDPEHEQPELRQRRRRGDQHAARRARTSRTSARRLPSTPSVDKQLVEQRGRRPVRPPQARRSSCRSGWTSRSLFHPVLQAGYSTFALKR